MGTEDMQTTTVALAPGINRLPQLHNASVSIRDAEPEVCIKATASPLLGTRLGGARHPDAPLVALDMAWPDALRLAVEILRTAQATGQDMPGGVTIEPDRLNVVRSEPTGRLDPLGRANELSELELVASVETKVSDAGGVVALILADGYGNRKEAHIRTAGVAVLVAALNKARAKAEAVQQLGAVAKKELN
jgi:hypothetical protein